nr:CAZy families GT2 protein [uncultured Ruminococcus sp.]
MEVCLRSLLKGGDEVEIIIVDDGSTDDTGRIADSYALKFPKIVKAIHQPTAVTGQAS